MQPTAEGIASVRSAQPLSWLGGMSEITTSFSRNQKNTNVVTSFSRRLQSLYSCYAAVSLGWLTTELNQQGGAKRLRLSSLAPQTWYTPLDWGQGNLASHSTHPCRWIQRSWRQSSFVSRVQCVRVRKLEKWPSRQSFSKWTSYLSAILLESVDSCKIWKFCPKTFTTLNIRNFFCCAILFWGTL